MNILALDTSSKFCSISIQRKDQVLAEYNFYSRDNLSATLLPSIDYLFNDLNWTVSDIDLIGVAIGPGMFTGIRVGLSFVKGLIFQNDIPLVTVDSLSAWAGKLVDLKRKVLPLIDAGRGEVYLAGFTFSNGVLEEVKPPELIPLDAIGERVPDVTDYVLTGSGAIGHRSFLINRFPGLMIADRSAFLAPEVGWIAHQGFQKNRALKDLKDLKPFYIRRPDAEVNLQGKSN